MPIQKVLVVDDSKTELMFLTDLLQKKGMQVRTAENADEAFRRLAEEKPDLILMDVVMPGQNGFQLTRAITRDPLYADVPIIMCTSKNQETDRVWGMRQGARGYLTKPVDPAELQAKIDALNYGCGASMANREALRELQTRLASRLQAARVEGASVSSWLAVESAGSFYLLPLGQSGEIFPWVAVQAVPYTQSWFLGVANLRGGLFGVADLAGLMGSMEPRTEQALSEASLLAFNAALDVNAALLVDRLAGLRGTDAFVSSEPPTEDSPAFFGTTYVDSSGTRWQELNLQVLSQHPAFLSISA